MPEREPHSPRQTYHSEIERLLQYHGKTYADIARQIGLTSFGAKRPGEMLRECASPEGKIIGYDYGFSRALIARILTANDEKTYKTLLRLSCRDRRAQRAKTASITDSPIRDERELYAVSAEDAADLLDVTEDYLLRLEQGKRVSNRKKEKHIITRIRSEGERRIRNILDRTTKPPTTIRGMIDWLTLQKRVYGEGDRFAQLCNRLPGIGHELLKYIAHGKDMPPLPVIRRILAAGEVELTEELTQDWAYQFALFERRRSPTDIGRALQSICAETYESRGAFERMYGLSLKKSLQRIQRGVRCELKSIHKALRQLDVCEGSPRWLWIESLYKEGSMQPALRYWHEQMHIRSLPIDWDTVQLPGLTREESPKLILREVLTEFRNRYPHLPERNIHIIQDAAFPQAVHINAPRDIVEQIENNFGPQMRTANMLQILLKQARVLDAETCSAAPDRIADTIAHALHRGITDIDTLIRNTLTTERLIQWAFTYNLTIASPYYDTLRRSIEESVQQETSYEELQQELKAKIDVIAARDQDMALDDNAPGIHQAKSKTGRKSKGPNNY